MPNRQLKQIMTRQPATLSPDTCLDAVSMRMADQGISSILIVEQQRVVGIVTEKDILRAFRNDTSGDTPVAEVMSKPVCTAPEDTPFLDAYHLIARQKIRHLVIVDSERRPVGIASITDFERHLGRAYYERMRDVQGIMQSVMPTMALQATLSEALQAMADLRSTCVVVVENYQPIGILTERDVVRHYRDHTNRSRPLGELMTPSPVTVAIGTPVTEAAELMHRHHIRHLVVIDGAGHFAGLVGEADLVRHLESDLAELSKRVHQKAQQQMAESRSRWHAVFDEATQLMGVLDGEARILEANRSALLLVDTAREAVIGQHFWDTPWWRHDPAGSRVVLENALRHARRGDPVNLEVSHLSATGQLHWVMLSIRRISSEPERFLAESRDITARKEDEARLRLVGSVFANTHDAILITDLHGFIIEVNAAFTRLTGYTAEEAIGRHARMLNSGHHASAYFAEVFAQVRKCGYWSGEVWNRTKDGRLTVVLMTISQVLDDAGRPCHYVGIFTDITDKKENEHQLERMAHYDVLTGLPNRALLTDRLRLAIAQAGRKETLLAVCYLDLDGFKPVNDRYGHHVGDLLLVEVGNRLRSVLRSGDTAARLGGDEFVLLVNDLPSLSELQNILDRLLKALAMPVEINRQRIDLSASIGVTIHPNDGVDADTLLRHADQAMYDAKRDGRNRYRIFDLQQHSRAREVRATVADLEKALHEGCLTLHYQPKISLIDGSVVGFEALLRWPQADGSLRLPAEFLPLVEDHDVIVDIGDWVIDQALRQLDLWRREQGRDLPVSINIAARQLQQDDFFSKLLAQLQRYCELPPQLLELEILETAALDDLARIGDIMHSCQALGVSFALDDFGTGYSSLSYLKKLPANNLKIDQSFVRDMVHDPEALAIVEGVLGLTNAFQRGVIAEGVEGEEHGILLTRLGCSQAQGYAIARPMPAAEVDAWLASFVPPASWLAAASERWHQEDYPLVAAEIDHRHWLEEIIGRISLQANARRRSQVMADASHCRFGRWFNGHGRQHYADLAEFAAIGVQHARVHALSEALLDAIENGDTPLDPLLAELHAANHELRAQLHQLQRLVIQRNAREHEGVQ